MTRADGDFWCDLIVGLGIGCAMAAILSTGLVALGLWATRVRDVVELDDCLGDMERERSRLFWGGKGT